MNKKRTQSSLSIEQALQEELQKYQSVRPNQYEQWRQMLKGHSIALEDLKEPDLLRNCSLDRGAIFIGTEDQEIYSSPVMQAVLSRRASERMRTIIEEELRSTLQSQEDILQAPKQKMTRLTPMAASSTIATSGSIKSRPTLSTRMESTQSTQRSINSSQGTARRLKSRSQSESFLVEQQSQQQQQQQYQYQQQQQYFYQQQQSDKSFNSLSSDKDSCKSKKSMIHSHRKITPRSRSQRILFEDNGICFEKSKSEYVIDPNLATRFDNIARNLQQVCGEESATERAPRAYAPARSLLSPNQLNRNLTKNIPKKPLASFNLLDITKIYQKRLKRQ